MAYIKPPFPNPYIPSASEVNKYHRVWNSLTNYIDHEKALSFLFRDPESPYIKNDDIAKVIIKVSALNDFYSTKLYRVHDVAQKIVSIKDFDKRLEEGDLTLVEDLRELSFRAYAKKENTEDWGWKDDEKDIYSFATKYCSHHQPDKFPIYDKYVDKVFIQLKKQNPKKFIFKRFDSSNTKEPIKERKEGTLKEYKVFVDQIDILRKEYNLQDYSYKDIDRYLWQLGKRYFAPYPDSVNGNIDYNI